MIFDVCMHSGHTIKPIKDALEKVGYKNIFIELAQPKTRDNDCETNFSALHYGSGGGCYPFRRDYIIEKNRKSIISSKSNDLGDRKMSSSLRKELSSLF